MTIHMIRNNFTTQEYVAVAQSVHGIEKYDYSNTIFQGCKNPIEFTCNTCKKEKKERADHHVERNKDRPGCKECYPHNRNTKMDTKTWVAKAKKIWGTIYTYQKTEYVDKDTKVEIYCTIHEDFFWKYPGDFLNRLSKCPDCHFDYMHDCRRLTRDQFIEKAHVIFGDLYDYSLVVYVNNNTKVMIICKKHEETFEQLPSSHLQEHGCYKCGRDATGDKLRLTKEEFIERAIKIHGDKYQYHLVNYVNGDTKVIIVCPKENHGEFLQRPHSHVQHENGCPQCPSKWHSKKQIEWLDYVAKTENIHIKHEENGGEEPIDRKWIDGYCAETKTVYEFHGNYYHGNPRIYTPLMKGPRSNKKTMGDVYVDTLIREDYIMQHEKVNKLVVMWEDTWDAFVRSQKLMQEPAQIIAPVEEEKKDNVKMKKPRVRVI